MNTRQAKIGMGEYEGGVIREDATFTVEHTAEEVRGHRFVLLANMGAVAFVSQHAPPCAQNTIDLKGVLQIWRGLAAPRGRG